MLAIFRVILVKIFITSDSLALHLNLSRIHERRIVEERKALRHRVGRARKLALEEGALWGADGDWLVEVDESVVEPNGEGWVVALADGDDVALDRCSHRHALLC